ncbi:MAG: 4Fe-4S binding protein [Planctomycetota bacterium]
MSTAPKGCQVAGPKTRQGIRASRVSRWRAAVLIGLHVLIAIHIAHWMETGRTVSPLEPSEAMEFSKRSAINAGFLFFLLMIGSTLILGRFFCGWACHLVAVQDFCAWIMKRLGITPRPLRSRLLAFVPFLAGFYMFLWPFFERMRLDVGEIPVTLELESTQFWATFPGLVISIVTFLVAGFAAVYFLGAKGFCTNACPYGAFMDVADRFAPLRIRVDDSCEGCGHCTIACTSNVAVAVEVRKYGMVVDPGCMKCLDCVSVCPNDALHLGFGKPAIAVRGKSHRRPRFTWGWELLLAVSFAAAFFTFRGLYGQVPFLLSLGIAGVLAFFVLRTVELFTKNRVVIAPFVLKDQGRLTASGKIALGCFAMVFAFWGHSAWIRYEDWQSKRAYAPLVPVRDAWFTTDRPAVTDELTATAREVVRQADHVIEEGLWETPRVRVERAWARMVLGDVQGFREDMAVVARLSSKDVNCLVEPAHSLRAEGPTAEALPLYRDALRRGPDHMDVMRYLVDASREAGQWEIAQKALEDQVERRTWDAPAWEFLGIVRANQGDLEGAIADWNRALELAGPARGPWRRLLEAWWNQAENREGRTPF